MAGCQRISEAQRFMNKVSKQDSGCWLWLAYKMNSGYGNFRMPTRHELAHRASHRLFKGPLVAGLEILHACDNPSCVNPDHLSQGTRTDNAQDAKRKGRNARGSGHGRSKLTEAQVKEIRASTKFQRAIAKDYGVTQAHVSSILLGKSWNHTFTQGDYHR